MARPDFKLLLAAGLAACIGSMTPAYADLRFPDEPAKPTPAATPKPAVKPAPKPAPAKPAKGKTKPAPAKAKPAKKPTPPAKTTSWLTPGDAGSRSRTGAAGLALAGAMCLGGALVVRRPRND